MARVVTAILANRTGLTGYPVHMIFLRNRDAAKGIDGTRRSMSLHLCHQPGVQGNQSNFIIHEPWPVACCYGFAKAWYSRRTCIADPPPTFPKFSIDQRGTTSSSRQAKRCHPSVTFSRQHWTGARRSGETCVTCFDHYGTITGFRRNFTPLCHHLNLEIHRGSTGSGVRSLTLPPFTYTRLNHLTR